MWTRIDGTSGLLKLKMNKKQCEGLIPSSIASVLYDQLPFPMATSFNKTRTSCGFKTINHSPFAIREYRMIDYHIFVNEILIFPGKESVEFCRYG